MIRSVTIVLGGLFLISIAYYLAFWEQFSIDIFQYMQVTDIIKGAMYPMRFVGMWYLGAVALVVVGLSIALLDPKVQQTPSTASDKQQVINEKVRRDFLYNAARIILVLVGVLGLFILFISISTVAYTSTYIIPLAFLSAAYSALTFFALKRIYINGSKERRLTTKQKKILLFGKIELLNVLGRNEHEKEDKESHYLEIADYLALPTFIYLIISAILLGRIDSDKINNGIEYNYVKNVSIKGDSTVIKFPKLIYLGTVSEKVIFIHKMDTCQTYVLINKDKLPVMEVYFYNKVNANKVSGKQPRSCANKNQFTLAPAAAMPY